MVIWPLLGDATLMRTYDIPTYERYLMNQIDEIGNHPALLMFTLGNELNIYNDASLLNLTNGFIAFAKSYSLSKWGRSIPITNAVVDNPTTYPYLYANLNVDVFTTNAGYRGLGFQALWDDPTLGLGNLSVAYNKPNFVGEMGWSQINGSETINPINAGWFNYKWKDLIQKGSPNGCVGGAFFEYLDEVYSKADPRQQTMGLVSVRISSLTDFPATTGSVTTGLPPSTVPTTQITQGGQSSQAGSTTQVTQGQSSQTASTQGSQSGQGSQATQFDSTNQASQTSSVPLGTTAIPVSSGSFVGLCTSLAVLCFFTLYLF